jgi:hypothetical protein
MLSQATGPVDATPADRGVSVIGDVVVFSIFD